jgi:hypothetical protein
MQIAFQPSVAIYSEVKYVSMEHSPPGEVEGLFAGQEPESSCGRDEFSSLFNMECLHATFLLWNVSMSSWLYGLYHKRSFNRTGPGLNEKCHKPI